METFKIFLIRIVSCIRKILWIIPVHPNRILFISFNGKQFSDSPKYIYDYMKVYFPYNDYIWVFTDPSKFEKKVPKSVPANSLKYYYYFCTSKVIVTNNFIETTFPVRSSQFLINTWHGGGWFKKVGLTDNQTSDYDKFFFKYNCNKHSLFVASSEYFVDTVLKDSFGYRGKVIRTGLPRNAILLQENQVLKEQIKQELKISDNPLVVMYAPTFRSYETESKLEQLDFNLLKKSIQLRFNRDVIFLYRAHHLITENNIDFTKVIDVTNYPDMQKLLFITDILVSDYSSCMWDAAIQKKIVIVYAPDAKKYSDNRGFFLDIEKWPFLISYTNTQLADNIIKYDERSYMDYLNHMILEAKSYENPNSVKHMVDVIVKMLNRQDYSQNLNI